MSQTSSYKHVQYAPLCLLLYVLAVVFVALGWVLKKEQSFPWLFPLIGMAMFLGAGSFHYLKVEDHRDRLSISFGPIPLFRQSVRYEDILSAEIGRTTILDGIGNTLEPAGRLGLEFVGARLRGAATANWCSENRHRRCEDAGRIRQSEYRYSTEITTTNLERLTRSPLRKLGRC